MDVICVSTCTTPNVVELAEKPPVVCFRCEEPIPDPGVEAANPTGLFDTVTGMPIFSTLDEDGVITQLYYHDPITGDQIVTTTGFSAAPPVVQTNSDDVYDTLTSGVVERATKYATVTDGVPTAITYTEFDSVTPYVPSGIVAPRPQKVQMGQEDLTVTGAGIALAAVPTAANSKGQNFPQHVLIHVHVDSADNAFGIAYTTDGTNPAEAHEFERSEGHPIELDTHEEIVNFRAAPLDANGDIAATETIQITAEYNNIDEDKDDV